MSYLHAEATEKFPFNTPAGYDFKAWAKRILWRHEQQDPELLAVQIKFAADAMGIKPEKQE
ncbi:MAG TPA: hypothetical protein VN028_03975 [Rhodocyclaceae bacterium]|nr:hypothetical protein [Rhodocyclaceae bacterium]